MTFLLIMTGLLLVGLLIFLLDQKNRGSHLDFKTIIFVIVSASLLVFGYVNIQETAELHTQNQDLRNHIQNIEFQVSSLRNDLYRFQNDLEEIRQEDAMIQHYEAIPIAFDTENDAIRFSVVFRLKERPSESQVSLIQTDQYGIHTVYPVSSLSLDYRQEISLATNRTYDLSVLISGETVSELMLDTIDLGHILENRISLEPYDLFEAGEDETTVVLSVSNAHFDLEQLKIVSVVFDIYTDNGDTKLATRTLSFAQGEAADREFFILDYTTLSKNIRDLFITATVTDALGNVYTLTGGL